MTKVQKAAETRRRNRESKERIRQAQEETRRVVESGVCPKCGAGLRRNSSMTGWWQCEQFGAEGFRKDSSKPSCSWQGFTQ
jgi:hypothetical protein